MDIGVAIPSAGTSWQIVERAGELGFTHAWFYDTQQLCADVFVSMAAAAVKTHRIRLGTGVLIPTNRLASVTANAFASLNQLAPGRIDFGVGTGFTGRRTMGAKAMKLQDMQDYIDVVYAMLRGETAPMEFEGVERQVRFLNPELGLINLDDPVRLHVSAFGQRSREMTARMKADWINIVFTQRTGDSPEPTYRMFGSEGVTAMLQMPPVPKYRSEMLCQLVPASVVFHTPPPVAPM